MLPLLIDENLNQRILRGLRRVRPHLDYAIAQNIGLSGAADPASSRTRLKHVASW